MVLNDDGPIADELNNRLNGLFGENGQSPVTAGISGEYERSVIRESDEASEVVRENGSPETPPLTHLKAIVLSVDWEINNETMNDLVQETERLKRSYANDRALRLFFQLLSSVGKYIKANKVRAHPDSIRLLNSIYSSLEKVMLSEGLTETERNQVVLTEVKKFRELKEQIGSKKNHMTKEKEVSSPKERTPTLEILNAKAVREEMRSTENSRQPSFASGNGHLSPHKAFAFALEEIKDVIRVEFKSLRSELKLWREGR